MKPTTDLRVVRRALQKGDATIIGVGQGPQTVAFARPRQTELAESVRLLGRSHLVTPTVDSEGERGMAIIPKLSAPGLAASLGRRFGQRSVMQGKEELDTSTGAPLARYRVERVDTAPPQGFFTLFEREGLYYQLVPVTAHLRSGRVVRGYATRRRLRLSEPRKRKREEA